MCIRDSPDDASGNGKGALTASVATVLGSSNKIYTAYLLKGYSASFIDHGEKLQHVQEVLRRCWDTIDSLPSSLLKLRLLTACYGEVFDEPLADEGRSIIASWSVASIVETLHRESF